MQRRTSGGHGPWSLTDLLLAGLIDAINKLDYHQLRIAGAESVPKPEPVSRPGVELTMRQLSKAGVAYLERIRRQRQGDN